MKIGIVSNGRSRRNRRSLAAVQKAAATSADVVHVVLDGIDGLESALAEFAQREVGIVAVNGGDGTVQAVLTMLIGDNPFPRLPLVAVLPGGTTNMTSADIGLRGGRIRGLARLIAAAADGSAARVIAERHVVGVDRGVGEPIQYGMFFGTAGICRAIEYCRRAVHPLNVGTGVASALTLAGLLARLPFSGGGNAVLSGDRIAATFDGGAIETADHFLLLVTTLERLVLRSRPFWGSGSGALRYTSVRWPPRRLLTLVPRVMYGSESRRLPSDTYDSRRTDRVTLAMDCPYTLDGEIFRPVPGVPVTLHDGGKIAFVRL